MASADLGRRSEDVSSNRPRVNVVSVAILLAALGLGALAFRASGSPAAAVAFAVAGLLLAPAPRIARQWERDGSGGPAAIGVGRRRCGSTRRAVTANLPATPEATFGEFDS